METIPERVEARPEPAELRALDAVAPEAATVDQPLLQTVRARRRPRVAINVRRDVLWLMVIYLATRGLLMLAAYGVVSALVYGLVINFWFWPFVGGSTTTYSFVPGLGTIANLHRFILFDLTTSMGFDLTRAATCAVMVLVLGRPVLAALRRASRRAAFEAPVEFTDETVPLHQ